MKHIFLTFFLLPFSFHLLAQQDSGFTNKAEAKNLMVGGLKEGKWVEYLDANEDTIKKGVHEAEYYRLIIYKAGVPDGIVKVYLAGNILVHEIPYANGKKNGVEKTYQNGNISKEIPYTDGKINGIEREYMDSSINLSTGQHFSRHIRYEMTITDDKANGIAKEYYDDGKLMRETPYMNGKIDGIVKTYYQDGRLQRIDPYKKDIPVVGGTKVYSETGKEIK